MESISAEVVSWLLVLSIVLRSFLVFANSRSTKEVAMNSIKNTEKWFDSFLSLAAVYVLETVWAVLTSLVAGICLLA
jgi:hypothetical protein